MKKPGLLVAIGVAALAQQPAIQQSSREDHQGMLNQLRIAPLRPMVNARVVGSANYDEAKANPYPDLPPLLTLKNGKKVTSVKMWWDRRRPESEVYVRLPRSVPKVKWEVVKTAEERVGDVPRRVDNSAFPEISVDIQLTLSTPVNAKGPVPVIMAFGGGRPAAVSPAQQGAEPGPNPASIQADNGGGLRKGMIGLVNKGHPHKPDDWGALRAWAWGADRALDYFETDKAVDAKRVAMAYDPRLAIVFVSFSGEGGAKLHRRNYGEPVENVASPDEYHWMAGNFLKYAGPLQWSDLPVDSHQLIAMCAPRPVFLSAGNSDDFAVDIGNSDAWVDAKGAFPAGVGVGPVYHLLGKKDLGTSTFPPINTGILNGDLAFRQHSAGHTPNPNRPYFLTFAERYFK
jgi:hypothetical protein